MSWQTGERKIQYSRKEEVALSHLLSGRSLTPLKLCYKIYGPSEEEWPYHARNASAAILRSLAEKIKKNAESMSLNKKGGGRGCVEWKLVRRKGKR